MRRVTEDQFFHRMRNLPAQTPTHDTKRPYVEYYWSDNVIIGEVHKRPTRHTEWYLID